MARDRCIWYERRLYEVESEKREPADNGSKECEVR